MEASERTLIVCPYCGVGCRLYIRSIGGYPIGIEYASDVEGIANEGGKLCPKGNAVLQYLLSKDRLRKPLKAVEEGRFREVSWRDALREVAGRLKEIRARDGADAVMFFGSARTFNEPNYLIQKLARLYGTDNVDHCARLCHSATVSGLRMTLGAGAMTNSYADIGEADCILIWGHNYAETHPVGFRYVLKARDRGAKVFVVDPRRTRSAWFADAHLQLLPGTDIALANGLMHVIIKEELYDKEFVARRTRGFERLVKVVEKYPPERVEEVTGVPRKLIVDVARTYASAEKAVITWAMGLTQHICGTDNVRALATLAAICGHLGKEGAGLSPMRGQNNVQGACDMGVMPETFPGYKDVVKATSIEYFKKLWGVESLPTTVGYTVMEACRAVHEGKVKAYYIMGENPVVSDANSNHLREALKKLEFLVVQDIFLTETAAYADIVLPAAALPECEGSLTNTERRVQWSFKAADPPGDARPDWWILTQVAKLLGLEGKFPYTSIEEVTLEICAAVPQYRGITPGRLKKTAKGIQWPCPNEEHPGTRFLYRDKFLTPDGKAALAAVEHVPPAEPPDEEYPLILTTVRVVGMYHTNTMTGRSPSLVKRWPEPYIEINPVDARRLGIEQGDRVKVITRRGEYVCKAKVTSVVREGVVAVPWHWGANVLTNDALDPISKIPETKVCACRVVKLAGG